MSTYADVVISPATTHRPVVSSVSQATRPWGSSARIASSTESLIWSAILSGWPSVTLSEVKVQRDIVILRRWVLVSGGGRSGVDGFVERLVPVHRNILGGHRVLGLGPLDLVGGDLLEPDAERLARHRGHLRRDHVAQPVTEVVEVGVDVAGPPSGERDQPELGLHTPEELLDRRVHHRVVGSFHRWRLLLGSRAGPFAAGQCYRQPHEVRRGRERAPSVIRNISSIVVPRSSFTTTKSARSRPIGSSVSALRSRARTFSSRSPRSRRRRS